MVRDCASHPLKRGKDSRGYLSLGIGSWRETGGDREKSEGQFVGVKINRRLGPVRAVGYFWSLADCILHATPIKDRMKKQTSIDPPQGT